MYVLEADLRCSPRSLGERPCSPATCAARPSLRRSLPSLTWRGTRQSHCRKCQATYRHAHYLANRDDYIKREVARINGYRIENRALMLAYLLAHPCVDCGATNPVLLDFDHRDPSLKRGYVGVLAAHKPWRLVLLEIAKCDVRCANCHQRRTARQFNWRKARNETLTAGPWQARELSSAQRPPEPASGEMRRCTGCGSNKPVAEFVVRNKRTGRRGTKCRSCRSEYGRNHYQAHRPDYLARTRAHRPHARDGYYAWLITYLRSHPCVDCGESDPLVLQFDHREGTHKVAAIAELVRRSSWVALLAEIAKCELRCANCHRVRTAAEFQWSKLIRESA